MKLNELKSGNKNLKKKESVEVLALEKEKPVGEE